MDNTNLYYKESGALGTMGPVVMGATAVIGSLLLGAIYGYINFYMPFIYLSFLLTIGCGIGMGFLLGKSALLGKVRNQKAVMAFALLAGLLAEYFGWVFWIHAFTEQEVLSFSPLSVFGMMGVISEEGVWAIFDYAPSGAVLYIIWLIEAGIIVGATFLIAIGNSAGIPYCENCDKWVESEVLSSRLDHIVQPEAFVQALESDPLEAISTLGKVDAREPRRTKVDLLICNSCNKEFYLSVSQVYIEIDDEGKAEEKEDTLVENLIINQQTYESLKTWNKQPDPAAQEEE